MTYLFNADYFVYYASLPWNVPGLVTPNDDGTFSIFLNDRHPDAWKLMAYIHEVKHIKNDDFYNNLPIQKVEGL